MVKVVSVDVNAGTGFANALRRSLIADVASWAPSRVKFGVNQSIANDEFLSHRIGQVPFRRISDACEQIGTIDVVGPTRVTMHHFSSLAFEPVHKNIELIHLGPEERLQMTVSFDRGCATRHARYMSVAAVGMRQSRPGAHVLRFEPHDEQVDPRDVLEEALTALEARVDRALLGLADQDGTPRKVSFC
jgi:hypothetical protein